MSEKERIVFVQAKNPANASRSGSKFLPTVNVANGTVQPHQNGLMNGHSKGSMPGTPYRPKGGAPRIVLQKVLSQPAGLINSGVNCFFNASLQGLFACPAFVDFLLNLQNLVPKDSGTVDVLDMLCRLVQSFQGAELKNRKVFNAVDVLRLVRKASRDAIQANRQEDSHEAMCVLFDMMEKSCLRRMDLPVTSRVDRTSESTVIHTLFGGALTTSTKCPECKHCSAKVESFLQLSLELDALRPASVAGLLRKMSEIERLDAKNMWECDGCKKKVMAERQTVISKTPPVLIVHLKRFGFSFANGRMKRTKLKTPVPLQGENLTVETGDGTKVGYSLVGVLVHEGASVHSGHYFSFIKCARNGYWYAVDDEIVTRVKAERVVNQKDAYMLFYCQNERMRLNQMVLSHVVSPRLSPRALPTLNTLAATPLTLPPRPLDATSAMSKAAAVPVNESAGTPSRNEKAIPSAVHVVASAKKKSPASARSSSSRLSSYASSVVGDMGFLAIRRARIEASVRSSILKRFKGLLHGRIRGTKRRSAPQRKEAETASANSSDAGGQDAKRIKIQKPSEGLVDSEAAEGVTPVSSTVVDELFSFDKKMHKKKRFGDAWDKALDKGRTKKVRS